MHFLASAMKVDFQFPWESHPRREHNHSKQRHHSALHIAPPHTETGADCDAPHTDRPMLRKAQLHLPNLLTFCLSDGKGYLLCVCCFVVMPTGLAPPLPPSLCPRSGLQLCTSRRSTLTGSLSLFENTPRISNRHSIAPRTHTTGLDRSRGSIPAKVKAYMYIIVGLSGHFFCQACTSNWRV